MPALLGVGKITGLGFRSGCRRWSNPGKLLQATQGLQHFAGGPIVVNVFQRVVLHAIDLYNPLTGDGITRDHHGIGGQIRAAGARQGLTGGSGDIFHPVGRRLVVGHGLMRRGPLRALTQGQHHADQDQQQRDADDGYSGNKTFNWHKFLVSVPPGWPRLG